MNPRPPCERPRRRASYRRGRRGAVLVLFVMLSFVLMGIAALVIDLGAARLAQSQMQAAADSSALEILRDRDQARNPQMADNHFERDYWRRLRGKRLASWHYLPALVTGQEDGSGEHDGPGGHIEMGHGSGPMNTGQLIQGTAYGAPRLEANYAAGQSGAVPLNLPWGDVVSGEFIGHADGADPDDDPDGDVGFDGNPFHLEDAKYTRTDFVPADPQRAPYADSVTVRLRRTVRDSQVSGVDYEGDSRVSSAGDALPFLFGRGTGMHGGQDRTYSARRDGVGVRATAIAHARPAVRVSPPLALHDGANGQRHGFAVGTAPFAIQAWIWQWKATPVIWEDVGNGDYIAELKYIEGELRSVDLDDFSAGFLLPITTRRVGDRVHRLEHSDSDAMWDSEKNWEVEEAYAPVLERLLTDQGFSDRIIGFVRVRAQLTEVADPETGELQRRMRLWKLANMSAPGEPWIAARNASASFDGLQADADELAQDMFHGEQVWSWELLLRGEYLNEDQGDVRWYGLQLLERAIRAPLLVR